MNMDNRQNNIRYTPPPDTSGMEGIAGYNTLQKHIADVNARAREAASKLVEDLPPHVAARRITHEEQICRYKLWNKPTYQCAQGHLHELLTSEPPETCGKCGAEIVEKCECGATMLLTYTYAPPYRKLDPISGDSRRETCFGCGSLYPWARNYLIRPSESKDLDSYEKLLLDQLHTYPTREEFFSSRKAQLHYSQDIVQVNFVQRLFGGGIRIDDKRHPRHSKWLEIEKDYAGLVIASEQKILRYRQSRWDKQVKNQIANSKNIGYWRALSGQEFEVQLAPLLRRRRRTVHHVGGRGDEGADLLIENKNGIVVVQCKAFNKPVGPGPVRDLYGALLHRKANEAWLVSLEGFTDAAINFAAGKPIRLLPIASFLKE